MFCIDMEPGEIERRFCQLDNELRDVKELLQTTHDGVITLTAKMEIPGHAPFCAQHSDRLLEMEKQLDRLRTKFWIAYGAACALLAVAQVIIAHYLKK